MHAFFNDISELLDLVLHCFLISLSDFCTFPGGWREPFSEPFDLLDGLAHRIGWNVSGREEFSVLPLAIFVDSFELNLPGWTAAPLLLACW